MSRVQRRVLVTGGAGFIGSHVAEAYIDAGWSVTVLDSLGTGTRRQVPAAAEFVQADIRSDEAAALVREGRFDVVNNHAAQIDVRVSIEDPRLDASINVEGLLNLIHAAVAAGTRRFVHVSSAAVYGAPDGLPIAEDARKRPENPYGVSKLAGEQYLHAAHVAHGLDYRCLRYSNVYGPRQDAYGEAGVVAIFANALLEGRDIHIFGDGEQTRDFIYVGDVVAANLLASAADLPRPLCNDDRAFNVGTGTQTSVNELARMLVEQAGSEAAMVHLSGRSGEIRNSSLNSARLRALGWQPRTSLAAGLRSTIEWLQRAHQTAA